jgi:hypothetical protein
LTIDDKKNDQTKLTMAENVSDELAFDPKSVLIFMGARHEPSSGRQRIEIVWQKDLLATLDMNQKALLLDALQKAAEFVAESMGSSQHSGAA